MGIVLETQVTAHTYINGHRYFTRDVWELLSIFTDHPDHPEYAVISESLARNHNWIKLLDDLVNEKIVEHIWYEEHPKHGYRPVNMETAKALKDVLRDELVEIGEAKSQINRRQIITKNQKQGFDCRTVQITNELR